MLDSPLNAPDADEQATRLRIVAEAIEDQSRRLDQRVEGMHYEGPAARHFRVAMTERHQRAQRVAERLRDMASQLQAGPRNT